MSTLRLIGVAGTAGAGKDTVSDMLCHMFGMQNLSSGDVLRAITRHTYHLQPTFNPSREQLFEVGTFLRTEVHPAAAVKLCVLQAKVMGLERVIVSGLRTMGEAEAIRDAGGIIIGVDADPKIRFGRIYERARDAEAQKTLEQFLERDKFENRGISDQGPGRGIGAIIESADILIVNNGTVEELQAELNSKVAPLLA